jgi:hypothetical protein
MLNGNSSLAAVLGHPEPAARPWHPFPVVW